MRTIYVVIQFFPIIISIGSFELFWRIIYVRMYVSIQFLQLSRLHLAKLEMSLAGNRTKPNLAMFQLWSFLRSANDKGSSIPETYRIAKMLSKMVVSTATTKSIQFYQTYAIVLYYIFCHISVSPPLSMLRCNIFDLFQFYNITYQISSFVLLC